ncbi:outer membrane beta-barrel protein [Peredibacter starrii]|uniref:Outer membrane beta-barrel protein n=1 Tax=Peredibacter starrii TaxID=28202 RepID=A0AAX4HKB8_9BACT|nr:outer membrane beta-barrel protein [Peredibacter starrii]WPU63645.1 outer membrane beta-barrel protein [Peredibacter starrii]
MKSRNLLVLALALSFASAYAQQGEEQVLNSAPINVDGYLAEDKPVTDGELEQIRGELKKQKMGTQLNKEKAKDLGKLTNQTEKLLDSQDEYIDQKIESTQAIKEFNNKYEENQKKLRCIMEESDSAECDPYKNKYLKNKQKRAEAEPEVEQQIQVQQAAPVVSTAEVAPAVQTGSFETIKLLPYAGGTSYQGEKEELEASLAAGLRLESNINSRFSIGVGVNYAQLNTNDFGGNTYNLNQGYYGYYGQQGREIQYKSMGLDLYGKFFITNGERFRPYLGFGAGYQRASLKYSENNPYSYYNPMYGQQNFGNEEHTANFFNGTLMAGSEIMITRGFGLNLEAAYSTGLSSGSSKSKNNSFNSPDEQRLKDLGKDITSANALSVFAGLVVLF